MRYKSRSEDGCHPQAVVLATSMPVQYHCDGQSGQPLQSREPAGAHAINLLHICPSCTRHQDPGPLRCRRPCNNQTYGMRPRFCAASSTRTAASTAAPVTCGNCARLVKEMPAPDAPSSFHSYNHAAFSSKGTQELLPLYVRPPTLFPRKALYTSKVETFLPTSSYQGLPSSGGPHTRCCRCLSS